MSCDAIKIQFSSTADEYDYWWSHCCIKMKWLVRLHRSTSQKDYLKVVRKTSDVIDIVSHLRLWILTTTIINIIHAIFIHVNLQGLTKVEFQDGWATVVRSQILIDMDSLYDRFVFAFSIVTKINISEFKTPLSSFSAKIMSNWFQSENLFEL